MTDAQKRKVEQLANLAMREHYWCEDGWYSCPFAEDGCSNDDIDPTKCTCGADEHNAKVKSLAEVIPLLG